MRTEWRAGALAPLRAAGPHPLAVALALPGAALLLLASCASAPGAERGEAPEGLQVEEARGGAAAAVRGLYAGLRGGAPEELYRWLEPEVLMLGTAPEEIWEGQPAVAAALGPRLATRSEAFLHEGRLDIRVGASLTTAFFHDEVRLAGTTRSGASIDLPMRVTGTLVRRPGGWRVASVHFSVPIPDADSSRYDRGTAPASPPPSQKPAQPQQTAQPPPAPTAAPVN